MPLDYCPNFGTYGVYEDGVRLITTRVKGQNNHHAKWVRTNMLLIARLRGVPLYLIHVMPKHGQTIEER